MYNDKIRFCNSWEDSVSLFYSWLRKEEESVKDKQSLIGDVAAISKAIEDAEVRTQHLIFNASYSHILCKFQSSLHELRQKKPPMEELCRNLEKGYSDKDGSISDGTLYCVSPFSCVLSPHSLTEQQQRQ